MNWFNIINILKTELKFSEAVEGACELDNFYSKVDNLTWFNLPYKLNTIIEELNGLSCYDSDIDISNLKVYWTNLPIKSEILVNHVKEATT